jgi:hypothetical protein
MALEEAMSRLALRSKYALSVEPAREEEIPPLLREYLDPLYQVEVRTLYEEGGVSRRQWIFRDEAGRTRLTAAGGGGFGYPVESPPETPPPAADPEAAPPEEAPSAPPEEAPAAEQDYSGLMEWYDEDGFITEDHLIDPEGGARIILYSYSGGVLIRAETRQRSPLGELSPVCTDYYRYSRSRSLRGVERVFHGDAPQRDMRFPPLSPGMAGGMDFVNPGSAYGSDFFQDILSDSSFKIEYVTDERGRILREIRRDGEGAVAGEITNHWIGDRLGSVLWKSGEDERLTEYEYDDAGDRILERNYRGTVLEREVRRIGDREIEELYMNGRPVLRSIWEGGRKISEEPVRERYDGDG